MQTMYAGGSLEVFYNDGTDKAVKQTYSNLNENVSIPALQAIKSALTDLSQYPLEEMITVNRTRYVV